MFDKRLMRMCPESKKYIAGNILLQFLELCLNAVMIVTAAVTVENVYKGTWGVSDLPLPLCVAAATVLLRFFTTRYAVRMSYLASRTVKRVMREKIYEKLLALGVSYREHVSTAELVQESVEGVDQLESYFGQYVPQFFYAFMAPLALFFLFGFGGSWTAAAVLLVCVPLIPGAIMTVQKIAKKILAKYWGQYTRLGSTFLENLQGMTTLKTYQADGIKNEEMNRESEEFRKVTMAVLTMQLNSITIMDFVAYGGADVGTVPESRLMKAVTYIGSRSVFFKGTVRENLLTACPGASDERLLQAVRDCALEDFLNAEQGLDTPLTENAGNLSGGQKQRLALARAILHDSPVYIFDEAASNIDVESEEAILTRIRAMAGEKTVVMISHRLASVTDADRIYVMENGAAVESGRHEELLAHGGVYARLWRTQQALEQYGREAV